MSGTQSPQSFLKSFVAAVRGMFVSNSAGLAVRGRAPGVHFDLEIILSRKMNVFAESVLDMCNLNGSMFQLAVAVCLNECPPPGQELAEVVQVA